MVLMKNAGVTRSIAIKYHPPIGRAQKRMKMYEENHCRDLPVPKFSKGPHHRGGTEETEMYPKRNHLQKIATSTSKFIWKMRRPHPHHTTGRGAQRSGNGTREKSTEVAIPSSAVSGTPTTRENTERACTRKSFAGTASLSPVSGSLPPPPHAGEILGESAKCTRG